MKTRFSSLVNVKKNTMQKSETAFKQQNSIYLSAVEALQTSINQLQEITPLSNGKVAEFLANRTLLQAQRELIRHNEEWVAFSKAQMQKAKEQLKRDTIEYEKYKYLEFEENKKLLDELKRKEMKDLDEIALMMHTNKERKKVAS